jgi:hypothetical protein
MCKSILFADYGQISVLEAAISDWYGHHTRGKAAVLEAAKQLSVSVQSAKKNCQHNFLCLHHPSELTFFQNLNMERSVRGLKCLIWYNMDIFSFEGCLVICIAVSTVPTL